MRLFSTHPSSKKTPLSTGLSRSQPSLTSSSIPSLTCGVRDLCLSTEFLDSSTISDPYMDSVHTQLAWDMFFANVVAMQYHPANPVATRQSVEVLARIADEMLIERNKRCLRFGAPE